MIKLTSRQQEILDFIRHAIEKTGFPPTRAEIARALGFKSANAAEDHLKALAKKGAITVLAGTSRGIRLLPEFSAHSSPSSADPEHSNSAEHVLSTSSSKSSTLSGLVTRTKTVMQTVDELINSLSLPVVGRVAGGNPILAEEHVDKTLHLDPALFSSTPDYLLKVKGESMREIGILDGDLLAVKRQTDARNGQIVVARIDDEVTVKRFMRAKNHIELLPENSDFEPIIVTPDREFSIEGIAVGLIRQQQYH